MASTQLKADGSRGLVLGNSNKPTFRLDVVAAAAASANYVAAAIEAGASKVLRLRKVVVHNVGVITTAQQLKFEFVRTNGRATGGTLVVPGTREWADTVFSGLCRIAGPTLILGTPDGSTFVGLTGVASTKVLTTLTPHGFATGDAVVVHTLTGGSALVAGTTYYVILISGSTTTFQLATSLALAQAGTATALTSDVSAGTITKNIGLTAVASTDIITSASAHGLQIGQQVTFYGLTGGAGLTAGTVVFVLTVPSATTFTVSATAGGATLDITSDMTVGVLAKVDKPHQFGFWVPGTLAASAQITYSLEDDRLKPIVIPAGVTNGIALRAITGATGAASLDYSLEFAEEAA